MSDFTYGSGVVANFKRAGEIMDSVPVGRGAICIPSDNWVYDSFMEDQAALASRNLDLALHGSALGWIRFDEVPAEDSYFYYDYMDLGDWHVFKPVTSFSEFTITTPVLTLIERLILDLKYSGFINARMIELFDIDLRIVPAAGWVISEGFRFTETKYKEYSGYVQKF